MENKEINIEEAIKQDLALKNATGQLRTNIYKQGAVYSEEALEYAIRRAYEFGLNCKGDKD